MPLRQGRHRFPFVLFLLLCAGVHAQSGDVWRDATLYRDEWGIPHVYADNPFAMAFVFGYAQAEDHAEQMLLAYRLANGRLAEILGEPYADSDVFSLKMGHARLAAEAYPTLDPITRTVCEGFAMGVNAWLTDHQNSAPPWADGVQPQDILALWHAFLMSMAPFELPDIYRLPAAMCSGNAWATSPDRNSEGKAILVINPHQYHEGFFQWYEAHLVLGAMNVYGATLRGLPVIVQGHNERLGWAFTPNQSDFADMFREEFEPVAANPKVPRSPAKEENTRDALLLHYMANSVPYRVRVANGMETRYTPALIGERGPMFEHPERGLHSWFIGGYRDFGGLRQLLEMGASMTLDHFAAALAMQQIPCFHVLYADQDGNIFYLYNTKSGIRIEAQPNQTTSQPADRTYRWDQSQPHTLAALAWRAVIPPEGLPYILNPPSGYLQACGNPPWTATTPPVLNPESWPAWLALDRDSFRAMRVRQLLHQGQRSFRDHQSILFDVVSPAALELMPALMRATEARQDVVRTLHPDFQAGLGLLRDWNYTAETTSAGMTFFHLWLTFCRNRRVKLFGSDQDFFGAAIQGRPDAQEIMLKAVEDAARTMRNEYGTLERHWGDVHVLRRGSREAPVPGTLGGETIFTASDLDYSQGKWVSAYGYGLAMVVQFGETVESVTLMPFGESARPESPHFDDQFDLFTARQFKHARFLRDDVLRNASAAFGKTITLLPPGVSGAITLHGEQVIQSRGTSAVETPYPIPQGLTPFSLYIQAERKPPGTPISITLSVHIPPLLCEDAFFSQLQIYRHEPGLDWSPAAIQHQDVAARIIRIQDDALAEWYVVLGPEEAALKDNAAPDSEVPSTTEPVAPTGLDALLEEHTAQPVITGRGRLFRLERLDGESPANEGETEQPEQDPSSMRIFKLERHDGSGARVTPQDASPLSGIPGYKFGPDAKAQAPVTPEQEVIQKPESANKTENTISLEGELSTTEPPSDASPDSKSINDKPTINQGPESVSPPPSDEDTSSKPATLPEVIPKDPNYIFGPQKEDKPTDESTKGKKKIFKIERMR